MPQVLSFDVKYSVLIKFGKQGSSFLHHLSRQFLWPRLKECKERYCVLWIKCIKGFVYRLSYDCHIDIDRDVSAAYCRSSLGDRVDSLSRTIYTTVVVSDWCITDLSHGWWVPIQGIVGNIREQFPPLILPTVSWIETHQPWAKFVIHQSLTTTVIWIVLPRAITRAIGSTQ